MGGSRLILMEVLTTQANKTHLMNFYKTFLLSEREDVAFHKVARTAFVGRLRAMVSLHPPFLNMALAIP